MQTIKFTKTLTSAASNEAGKAFMNNVEMSIEAQEHPEIVTGEFTLDGGVIKFKPKRQMTLEEKQVIVDTFSQMLDGYVTESLEDS